MRTSMSTFKRHVQDSDFGDPGGGRVVHMSCREHREHCACPLRPYYKNLKWTYLHIALASRPQTQSRGAPCGGALWAR